MKRKLLIALLVVLALPIVVVVAARALRSHHDAPVVVKGRLLRMRNLFTEIYGARVGDSVVLFDAGIDSDGPALDALLAELHASRDDVSDVFLTHGHFDHVQASSLCKKARIHIGAADMELLAGRARPEPLMPRVLTRILPPPNIDANAPLHGREELTLPDGSKLLAVPLAGHTPGSYVLYFDGVLIAGDSIQISDGKLQFAMSMSSVDTGANKIGIAALKGVFAQPVDLVCTGHQGCTSSGEGQQLLDDLIARAL